VSNGTGARKHECGRSGHRDVLALSASAVSQRRPQCVKLLRSDSGVPPTSDDRATGHACRPGRDRAHTRYTTTTVDDDAASATTPGVLVPTSRQIGRRMILVATTSAPRGLPAFVRRRCPEQCEEAGRYHTLAQPTITHAARARRQTTPTAQSCGRDRPDGAPPRARRLRIPAPQSDAPRRRAR